MCRSNICWNGLVHYQFIMASLASPLVLSPPINHDILQLYLFSYIMSSAPPGGVTLLNQLLSQNAN